MAITTTQKAQAIIGTLQEYGIEFKASQIKALNKVITSLLSDGKSNEFVANYVATRSYIKKQLTALSKDFGLGDSDGNNKLSTLESKALLADIKADLKTAAETGVVVGVTVPPIVTVTLTGDASSITEGQGNVVYTVSGEANQTYTWKVDDNHTNDLVIAAGVLTLDNNGSGTFSVAAKQDNSAESVEVTTVSLLNSSGVVVASKTLTLLEDPALGQTFSLNTSADNIVGGSANDVINALSQATVATGTDTLTIADTINGGAGSDTLNITTNADNTDVTHGAIITNIETINIRAATVGTTSTLNATAIPGLTAVNANAGAGAVTVTGLAAGASIGVIGNGVVVNGTTTYGYATASSDQIINISGGTLGGNITSSNGTAGSVTVNSSGANNTVGTIDVATGTSVTSLTINATTALTATLAADYAATSSLIVKGAGDVSLSGLSTAAFKVIDASGSAGAFTVGNVGTNATSYLGSAGIDTVTLNTAITSAILGAGNDIVTTAAVATTTAGAVSGGEGNDTLIIASASDVNSTEKRAVYTGFEVLNNTSASTIAADGFTGVTSLITSAGGGFTALSTTQATAITVTSDQSAVTYSLVTPTGGSDVLSLTLKNASLSSSADVLAVTINGFETLNITSSSGNVDENNAAANTVSFASATDLTAINLAGAYAVNLILDNTAKAVTVANTLSGTAAVRIEGEVIKGSTITGTANDDTIETALAAVAGVASDFVTYNAGAGVDTITSSLIAINNINNAAANLKIDGGAGIDTLNFSAADASFADANFQHLTNIEKLTLVNTTSLSLTSGGYFDTNFKSNGVTITTGTTADDATQLIDLASYTGAAKIVSMVAGQGVGSDTVYISTGSGADEVSVTASSWVGQAGAAANFTVGTGAGADKISVTLGNLLATTSGAITINAGIGADTVSVVHTNSTTATALINFVVADGDSTAAASDKITGFLKADGINQSDLLNLQGTATVTATTTGTDGTDSGSIKAHAITNGIITFDDANTYATALVINQASLADVLTYLAGNITTAGDTVAFAYDSDSNGSADASIVFQQGSSDTVIELVGVTGVTAIGASAVTANLLAIA